MLGRENTCQSFIHLIEVHVPLVMSAGAIFAALRLNGKHCIITERKHAISIIGKRSHAKNSIFSTCLQPSAKFLK